MLVKGDKGVCGRARREGLDGVRCGGDWGADTMDALEEGLCGGTKILAGRGKALKKERRRLCTPLLSLVLACVAPESGGGSRGGA